MHCTGVDADQQRMKLTVGTTPVRLPFNGRVTPLVQNLGPGQLYFDSDPNVTAGTGVCLPLGAVYEFPRDLSIGGGSLWLVSNQANCDVRLMRVG